MEQTATHNSRTCLKTSVCGDRLQIWAMVVAGIAIVSSAFHFWPFGSNKGWQFLCPMNLAVFFWIIVQAGNALLKRDLRAVTSLLPPVSIFAFLCINVLSLAFAPDWHRTTNYTVKLAMMFIGGYLLFGSAMSNRRMVKMVFGLTVFAVMISVSSCLVARFGFASEGFGFFDNAYKYGTYIGTLVPLCAAYLLTSTKRWLKIAGGALVIGASISSGSLGTLAAILVGLVVLIFIVPKWPEKIIAIGWLVSAIGFLVLLNFHVATEGYRSDIGLAEADGTNLKQRYIEWQAEINLLAERPIVGTGAGCINEYRSNYYYRLPKLNTLKAFDQNGWLATGAEIGIVGLVCFCWIVLYHLKLAYSHIAATGEATSALTRRTAMAGFVGLISACVANTFSSVYYNGVLITFVLVLVLISRTETISGKKKNANY